MKSGFNSWMKNFPSNWGSNRLDRINKSISVADRYGATNNHLRTFDLKILNLEIPEKSRMEGFRYPFRSDRPAGPVQTGFQTIISLMTTASYPACLHDRPATPVCIIGTPMLLCDSRL